MNDELEPSPYETECDALKELLGAKALVVFVVEGNKGTASYISVPPNHRKVLPDFFRKVAEQTEAAIAMDESKADCPVCHVTIAFDPHSPLQQKAPPTQGCFTVCAHCASFLVLDKERWRAVTDEEVTEFSDDERNFLMRMRRLIEKRKAMEL